MAMISFVERLHALAEADPDRAAITSSTESLTRAELRDRAAGLARALRAAGVEADDFVSMALPNGVDWFVGALAAWMLGATPQPLNPRMPERELRAVLDLAAPRVVLALDPALGAGRTVVSPTNGSPTTHRFRRS